MNVVSGIPVRRLAAATLLTAGILAAACESGHAGAGEYVASAADRSRGDSEQLACFGIDTARAIVLGANEMADGVAFMTVASAAVLPDGTAAVADGYVNSWLWIFSPGGDVRARLGEPRDGPGGFRSLSWVRTADGTGFVAFDRRKAELTYFRNDGSFDRTISLAVGPDASGVSGLIAGPLESGSFVYTSSSWTPNTTQGMLVRNTLRLSVADPSGAGRVELGTVYGTEMYRDLTDGFFNRNLPFGRRTTIEVLGNRVIAATGDGPYVELIDARTGSRDTVKVPLAGRPLSSGEVEAFKVAWVDDVRVSGADENGVRAIRRIADEMPYPTTVPPYADIAVDPHGYIWFATAHPDENGASSYVIADTTGVIRDTLRLPQRAELLHVGARHIVARARDSLDVESALVFARTCAR